MAAKDDADRAKLAQISDMPYKAQAIWFLNGFWDSHQKEAEKFWAYVEKAQTLDIERKESGSGLDELNAHRLLEIFDETLTVREMRTQLRTSGALLESDRPKTVPLCHLLLARYKVDWHRFVNAPQGESEELARAQAKLDACKAAFAQAQAAEAELKAKEAELRQAQIDLDAALAEVKAQEDAYNAKTAELQRKSEEGGVVSRNKAKNELSQHLAEDPLPLRKAEITAEAAAKRNERALAAVAEARVAAEAAVAAAMQALHEAEAYLAEVSRNAGSGKGALWWIERELHEQRKYLPSSRGGIAK